MTNDQMRIIDRAASYIYYKRYFGKKFQTLVEFEDYKQECYIRVWKSIGSKQSNFKGESEYSTWVHQVCKNIYLNMVKSFESNKRSVSLHKVDVDGVDVSLEDIVGNQEYNDTSRTAMFLRTDDLSDEIAAEEIAEIAFREVAKKFHGPLWDTYVHYLNGEKYEVIAEIMKIPAGTVRSRIFRVKQALGEMVEECNQENQV